MQQRKRKNKIEEYLARKQKNNFIIHCGYSMRPKRLPLRFENNAIHKQFFLFKKEELLKTGQSADTRRLRIKDFRELNRKDTFGACIKQGSLECGKRSRKKTVNSFRMIRRFKKNKVAEFKQSLHVRKQRGEERAPEDGDRGQPEKENAPSNGVGCEKPDKFREIKQSFGHYKSIVKKIKNIRQELEFDKLTRTKYKRKSNVVGPKKAGWKFYNFKQSNRQQEPSQVSSHFLSKSFQSNRHKVKFEDQRRYDDFLTIEDMKKNKKKINFVNILKQLKQRSRGSSESVFFFKKNKPRKSRDRPRYSKNYITINKTLIQNIAKENAKRRESIKKRASQSLESNIRCSKYKTLNSQDSSIRDFIKRENTFRF